MKSDIDFSPIDKCTVPISDSLALRIYSDTRPHNLKIADLQKGLILVYRAAEMVGEGSGFGFPVLVYSNETYFSGTSRVSLFQGENHTIIRKEFTMDRISRNRFRNIKLENRKARTMIRYMAELYQKHPRFRFLAMKGLTRKIYIDTSFVKARPVGNVAVNYAISGRCILVKVDFELSKRKGLHRIFVLNEQGSGFFRKYVDSGGMELVDEEIGAWDRIEAEWARLTDIRDSFGFRLQRVDDSVLRRGREFLKDSLEWVGLDYELSSGNAAFGYEIEILGV
jgi:hypothetical protein